MTKTAVFPIPDLAWQSKSCPCRIYGIAEFCTSLGCSNPHSLIDLMSYSFQPEREGPPILLQVGLIFSSSSELEYSGKLRNMTIIIDEWQ